MPKYNGSASRYLFDCLCTYLGIAVLTVLFLGQIKCDTREGPGFNPFSTMPDGKLGISEFGAFWVGCIVLFAIGWLVREMLR